jgi:type II secretory pathway pseudopilin PulG
MSARSRRGHSLIELMAVTTVASVVFSVIGVSLYALTGMHNRVQEEAHLAAALNGFAQRLRDDAHAATEWTLGGEQRQGNEPTPVSVTLALAGGRTVVYDSSPDATRLRRRVVQDGRTIQRDTYSLPRGSQVSWQIPDEGESPLLAVIVARAPSSAAPGQKVRRETRIEAALGLSRRDAP